MTYASARRTLGAACVLAAVLALALTASAAPELQPPVRPVSKDASAQHDADAGPGLRVPHNVGISDDSSTHDGGDADGVTPVKIVGGNASGPGDIVPLCDAEDGLFPGSIFSEEQLRQGAVILYFIFAFYGFCVIALVCENYFLPTVEVICQELGLPPDIAAATFMSLASSAPELFVNVVTTFLTKSTMGVGTTVGSATFNVLGLSSFIGLAARGPIAIKALPVMRDSLLYMSAIGVTTAVVWDGVVHWYEALAMVLCSLAYLAFMFTHHSLARWARNLLSRSNSTIVLVTSSAGSPGPKAASASSTESSTAGSSASSLNEAQSEVMCASADKGSAESAVSAAPEPSPAGAAAGVRCWCGFRSALAKVWLFVSWPVSHVLSWTIVDCKKAKLRRLYPLTFFLCVIWIALAAYLVSWMLAVIGNTLNIPDAVMGITLLAAGGSTPEAVSAIIMSRKGIGSVGIANGLGANTLNMLMNLGMPWLVRSLLAPDEPWNVLSEGLPFDLVSLLSAVLVLNVILLVCRYRLCRTQGTCTLLVYLLFIVLLVLIELNVFHLFESSPCIT